MSVPMSHSSPWFNAELCAIKLRGRQLERFLREQVLTVNLQVFSEHDKHYKTGLNAVHAS